MSNTNNNNTNNGIGFFGLLTILFIGLKLANVISWSWWTVLIVPITVISLGIILLILSLILIFLKKV